MTSHTNKFVTFANAQYMIRRARKHVPSILLFIIIESLLFIGISLTELFFTPTVLARILEGVSAYALMQTILMFAVGLIILRTLASYFKDIHLIGRVELRMGILNDILIKGITTSNINTEKREFRDLQSRSLEYTRDNSSASENIWHTLQQLLQYILGFVIYLFILRHIDFRVILLSLATTLITHLFVLRANTFAHTQKKITNTYYSKLRYFNKLSRNRSVGKDIRMLKLRPWLMQKYDQTLAENSALELNVQKHYMAADVSDVLMTLARNGLAYVFLIRMAVAGQIDATQFILYFSTLKVRIAEYLTVYSGEFSPKLLQSAC